MSDNPLMELKSVWKVFEHRGSRLEVLRDLDLKVYRGDRIAIMGQSGAGKSTLLTLMGTLDEPTSGDILFKQQSLASRSDPELAEFRNKQVGFVFQHHHLLPEFTAVENAMLPGLIARQSRAESRRRAMHLLEQVGLEDRAEHQPGELSGGELHRVALARALFMEPNILLADELTGNLDLKTGAGIHEVLRHINEQLGVTVVVVTHDPRLAEQMPIRLTLEEGNLDATEAGDERHKSRVQGLDVEPSSASNPESSTDDPAVKSVQ